MDCARVDEELIAFQLAALDGATRAALEAHLPGCARCVSSFLALKRAMDAAEDATAPSQVTRARIRAEASRQLAALATPAPTTTAVTEPLRARRRAGWIVAATAVMTLGAPLAYRSLRPAPPPAVSAPQPQLPEVVPAAKGTVDTARTTPENLAFL